MMKIINIILGLTFSIFLCSGCYYDVEEELYPKPNTDCDTANVKFSTDVHPVLVSSCYVCHGNGNTMGNIDLDGYENIKVHAQNGRLVGSISHAAGYHPMPQAANKLPDCTIAKIRNWVTQGAQNN